MNVKQIGGRWARLGRAWPWWRERRRRPRPSRHVEEVLVDARERLADTERLLARGRQLLG